LRVARNGITLDLAVLGAAAALALIPQIGLRLPSGPDSGHFLAWARLFPDRLGYVPTVPFLLSLFADVAETANFLPLKLFASMAFGFMGWSAYRLVKTASRDTKIGLVSFGVVAFSGLVLESIAWGGYAQLLGIGLALGAVTATLAWHSNRSLVYASVAGALLGGAFLTHVPSALFGCMACTICVLLVKPPRRAVGLVLMASVAAPMVLIDAILLGSPSVAPFVPLLFRLDAPTAYWLFARIFGGAGPAPAIAMGSLLGLLVLVLVTILRTRLYRSLVLRVSAALLGAGLGLLLLIPAQFSDRLAYFLFFSLAAAAGLSGLNLNRKIRGSFTVLGLIVLYALAGASHYGASLSFYDVMTEDDLEVFAWLRENGVSSDGVIVSTEFPLVHGWWLEALTLMRPYIMTEFAWYVFQQERTRSVAASLALNGLSIVDAGRVKIVDGYPVMPRNGPGVFVYGDEEFYRIFSFDDALLQVSFVEEDNQSNVFLEAPHHADAKKPAVWQTTQGQVQGKMEFSWNRLRGSRTVLVRMGAPLEVSYDFEFDRAVPLAVTARFPAPDGISYTRIQSNGNEDLELGVRRGTGAEQLLIMSLSTENIESTRTSLIPSTEGEPSEIRLHLEPILGANSIRFSFALEVKGYDTGIPSYYEASSILRELGIRFVYLSATYTSLVQRLAEDPEFALRRRASHTLVFEFRDGTAR
jgi:hypothetical protein